MAETCIQFFGITDFRQIDQITIAQYEIMMEALRMRQVDENYNAHRQAFLNFSVQAERPAGKGKTRPVYRRFKQFFDYEKELKKAKDHKNAVQRIRDYVTKERAVKKAGGKHG